MSDRNKVLRSTKKIPKGGEFSVVYRLGRERDSPKTIDHQDEWHDWVKSATLVREK